MFYYINTYFTVLHAHKQFTSTIDRFLQKSNHTGDYYQPFIAWLHSLLSIKYMSLNPLLRSMAVEMAPDNSMLFITSGKDSHLSERK